VLGVAIRLRPARDEHTNAIWSGWHLHAGLRLLARYRNDTWGEMSTF
jgi:hypothetical protein